MKQIYYYIKLRLIILLRMVIEVGYFRLIFIIPIIISLILILKNKNFYSNYEFLIMNIYIIFRNSFSAKEREILLTMETKIYPFLVVGNLLYSVPFFIFYFLQELPNLFFFSLFICLIIPKVNTKNFLNKFQNIKVRKYLSLNMPYEWCNFYIRRYLPILIFIDIICCVATFLYSNNLFVIVNIFIKLIIISSIYVQHEPYFFFQFYNMETLIFLKKKYWEIFLGFTIICFLTILLFISGQFETSNIFLILVIGITLIALLNVVNIKYAYSYTESQSILQLFQTLNIGFWIWSIFSPIMIIVYVIFLFYLFRKAYRAIKPILENANYR